MPKSKGAKKAMKNFKKQYGDKEGERVYYATANKQGRDPDTFHKESVKLVEDLAILTEHGMSLLPQGTVMTVVETVGTGAIAMVPNALGGGQTQTSPKRKKKKKKKVEEGFDINSFPDHDVFVNSSSYSNDERINNIDEIVEDIISDAMYIYNGDTDKVMAYLKNKMHEPADPQTVQINNAAYESFSDHMDEYVKEYEVDEASNSQVSPLQQDH